MIGTLCSGSGKVITDPDLMSITGPGLSCQRIHRNKDSPLLLLILFLISQNGQSSHVGQGGQSSWDSQVGQGVQGVQGGQGGRGCKSFS